MHFSWFSIANMQTVASNCQLSNFQTKLGIEPGIREVDSKSAIHYATLHPWCNCNLQYPQDFILALAVGLNFTMQVV